MAREDNLYLQQPPQFNLADSVENLIKAEVYYCNYIQKLCTYGINVHSKNKFYSFFNCMAVLTLHYCKTVEGFEQQLKAHIRGDKSLYEELTYYHVQSYNTLIKEMATYTKLLTEYIRVLRPLVWKLLRGEEIKELSQTFEEEIPF